MSKYSLMSRPVHIDTEILLETARRLFLAKGYGVGTAEIAREAGISEGSIFKRFATKAELFRAAMGFPKFDFESFMEGLDSEETRENLVTLVTRLVTFEMQLVPRIVMLVSQPRIVPLHFLHHDTSNLPQMVLDAIADYLAAQAEKREISLENPHIAARALLGSCHSYAFFNFVEHQEPKQAEVRRFAQQLVEILWEGIAP